MRFADVVGHERAVARLARMAAADRVPNALLLLGPPGIGKRALANALGARLLCETAAGGDACGACRQCVRAAAGTHPDLRVLARDEDRRDIGIDHVRELTRWLALQPLMATRKVGVLDDAHCLNEHGQNALLKTLEEPPGRSVLVLVATSPALLLPTVRSRCQVIRLAPLASEDVARVLEGCGVPGPRARELAPLAEGAPGRALVLEGEDAVRVRATMLAQLPVLRELPADEVSKLVQDVSRGSPDAALATALGWYRDVLQVALVGDALPLRNPGAASAIRAAAARLSPVALLRQLEAVCDTITALEKNANRTLTLETMLLWLREIERGARAAAHEPTPWNSTP